MKRKLVFINTHPIQYFAPLYQAITHDDTFDLEVWYCSKHGLNGEIDKQFGQAVKWDIPLLEGYQYRFLRNAFFPASIYGFWGLMNLEVIRLLFRLPKGSILTVTGWSNFTYLISIFFGKIFGLTVCLRCESPLHKELALNRLKRISKSFLLGKLLFKLVDYFLYIGTQNKVFYEYYGIKANQLIFSPYAVDNIRFGREAARLADSEQPKHLKTALDLPPDSKIALFTGKLYNIKRPFDLIQAFHQISDPNLGLIVVGDGELRYTLEQYVRNHQMQNVVFVGFVNQSEISIYYAMANVIVLCSESETWGLSINEAMNFGLPAVVSDMVGCAGDLVKDGVNGSIFKKGNIEKLAEAIQQVLYSKDYSKMREASRLIIQHYSYQASVNALKDRFATA